MLVLHNIHNETIELLTNARATTKTRDAEEKLYLKYAKFYLQSAGRLTAEQNANIIDDYSNFLKKYYGFHDFNDVQKKSIIMQYTNGISLRDIAKVLKENIAQIEIFLYKEGYVSIENQKDDNTQTQQSDREKYNKLLAGISWENADRLLFENVRKKLDEVGCIELSTEIDSFITLITKEVDRKTILDKTNASLGVLQRDYGLDESCGLLQAIQNILALVKDFDSFVCEDLENITARQDVDDAILELQEIYEPLKTFIISESITGIMDRLKRDGQKLPIREDKSQEIELNSKIASLNENAPICKWCASPTVHRQGKKQGKHFWACIEYRCNYMRFFTTQELNDFFKS